jgi:hypothetical protein
MQHQTFTENPTSLSNLGKVFFRGTTLQLSAKILLSLVSLVAAWPSSAQELPPNGGGSGPTTASESREIIDRVIDGLKEAERAQNLYERIERVEVRKQSGDAAPMSVRVSRVIPAGTGTAKITLGPDGRPTDSDSYRAELDKLVKTLMWAAESGQPQREAYQKVQKKQKDRDELIEATRNAFIFTLIEHEARGDHTLSKYRMVPNPAFKSTSRTTSIFSKVKGFVWVDDDSHQMARVQGEVTDDISLGLFLAKINKGSRFLQDRYEFAPGLWLPSFTQYDFDGRKFFSSFGVHEKTYYSGYRRIGTPAEAIPVIQSEIARLGSVKDLTKDKTFANR